MLAWAAHTRRQATRSGKGVMAKTLPYFRWFPADAETDDDYASMTNSQVGLYHRLLNRAWLNYGIPNDPEAIRKMLRLDAREFRRDWEQVRHKFVADPQQLNRLVNPRMEEERSHAKAKSFANQRIGNANALRTRSVSNANETRSAHNARYESESGSGFSCFSGNARAGEIPIPSKSVAPVSPDRFREWLQPWPRVADADSACRAWLSVVNSPADESAAFAARDRYLASDEVSRGVIQAPERWLFVQARSGWAGKWPGKARDPDELAGEEARERNRKIEAMIEEEKNAKRNGSKGSGPAVAGAPRIS